MLKARYVFIPIIAGVFAISPAQAQTDYVALFKTKSCPANMTCAVDTPKFSPIPKFKMTLIADLANVAQNPICSDEEKGYSKAPNKAAQDCIAALNQVGLSDKQRSAMLVTQAYATQQLDNGTMASSEKIEVRRAAKLFRRAIATDPNNIEAYHGLANFYGMFGDKEGALYVYADILKQRPLDANLLGHISITYSNLGLKKEALDHAEQAFRLNPQEPIAIYALATAYYENEKFPSAEKLLLQAQDNFAKIYQSAYSYHKYASPAFMLVGFYLQTHQPAKGLEVVNTFFPKNTNSFESSEWFAARANFHEALGQLREAADDFEAAAKTTYPEMALKYRQQHDQILLRTNASGAVAGNIQAELALGKLQPILRTQIFLRGQGYKEVEITGKYDEPTQHALTSCLEDNLCKQDAGKRAAETIHP